MDGGGRKTIGHDQRQIDRAEPGGFESVTPAVRKAAPIVGPPEIGHAVRCCAARAMGLEAQIPNGRLNAVAIEGSVHGIARLGMGHRKLKHLLRRQTGPRAPERDPGRGRACQPRPEIGDDMLSHDPSLQAARFGIIPSRAWLAS